MPNPTDTGNVQEDERGQKLAEDSSALNPEHGKADADQTEANDPGNHGGGGAQPDGPVQGPLPNPDRMGRNAAISSAAAIGAALRGNPKKLAAGGIGGLILGLVIMAAMPLMGEIKLSTMMENLYKHGFRHFDHSYASRAKLAMRYWMKENLDPAFNPNKAIVNYDRSILKELYGKLRLDGRLEAELKKAGYKFEYRQSTPGHPWLKITSPAGDELLPADFDEKFDLWDRNGKVAANKRVYAIAMKVFSGNALVKRIKARRLMWLTGTKMKWFTKSKIAFAKLRTEMFNKAITWIISRSSLAEKGAIKLLSLLTGGVIPESTSEDISKQINSDITKDPDVEMNKGLTEAVVKKVVPQALTKALGDISNPVGWIILAISVGCVMERIMTGLYPGMKQLVHDYTGGQYRVVFIMLNSMLAQIHEGEDVDSANVGALMEMLVDANGRDFSASHNYQRSTGTDIPFVKTGDCDRGSEMCEAERPNAWILAGTMFTLTEDIKNIYFNTLGQPWKQFCERVFWKISDSIDKIIVLIANPVFKALLFLSPQSKWLLDKGMDKADALFQKVFVPFAQHLLPPVVTASTRGPKLANAASAGALFAAGEFMRSFCGDNKFGDPEAAKQCRLEGEQLKRSEDVVALERQEAYEALSPWEKIADYDNPRSLLSQFIVSTPSSPRTLMANLASITNSMFSFQMVPVLAGFGGQLIHPAVAAPFTEEPTGVDIYGYTEDQLNKTPLGAGEGEKGGTKGMDKFDNEIVACSILAGILYGEGMPAECDPDKDFGSTGESGGSGQDPKQNWGDPADLAKKVLALWGTKITGNAGAKQDLQTTANGGKVTNCKPNTPLHAALLATILKMAEKHTFFINNFNTGHQCDSANHPKGLAMDLNTIDGKSTDPGNAKGVMKLFAEEWFRTAPIGGGVGQQQCIGKLNVPQGMRYFDDPCNHLHVDVGTLVIPKTW